MPKARAMDMREPIPIQMKPLIPAISTVDEELRKDLQVMGCEGLLSNPWNVQLDDVLKEFKFERGN